MLHFVSPRYVSTIQSGTDFEGDDCTDKKVERKNISRANTYVWAVKLKSKCLK